MKPKFKRSIGSVIFVWVVAMVLVYLILVDFGIAPLIPAQF